ncbi:MAG TPA: hypothetical protein ENK91_12450, partial [Bacteroidetes bacterium]|nr:hypothetical protein [Bacteroidota bacterium]
MKYPVILYDREYEAYFEGGHEKFPSWRLLRENIGSMCGKDVTIERITFSDLQTLDIPEFCVKLDNASLDVPTQRVSFDVMAKSSIAGLEFARAEIPLKYPTALLGTNIVLNDKIEASKGIVINTSFYNISMYDIQDDEMVLAITSSCNGGESAFVLGTEYEKIADVTVDVETLGNLGSINPDDFEVDGLAKYFLDGACQEFDEKCAEGQVPLVACIVNEVVLDPIQIASGVGQFVEIIGDNFTTSPIVCQMVIPDADDGGVTSIYTSGVSQLFSLG